MKNLLFGLLILITVSCAKKTETGPSFTESEGTVTGISVTTSVNIGQDAAVTVDYNGAQSCDQAGHIERAQVGNTITVHAYYKHPSSGDPCLDSPSQLQLTFTFTPSQTGQYIFKSPANQNIADTLTVL